MFIEILQKNHPHPLTKPCVKVSPHTALHTQLFVHRHNLGVWPLCQYRIIGTTFKWYIRVVDAHPLVKRVVESLTCLGYGIGSGAVWTITIRVLVKARFYGRLYERRPQAGRLRSQWLPHPKKPRYKVTFPLRKVTFIFIDQSFALLTYDFQCFFVTLQPKYCIYFNYP